MSSFQEFPRIITLVFNQATVIKKLNYSSSSAAIKLVVASNLYLDTLQENLAKHSVNHNSSLEFEQSTFDLVNQYLGLEIHQLVFEACSKFDVNAFTAICGSLVGGGELVIHLPADSKSQLGKLNFGALTKISSTLARFINQLFINDNTQIKIEKDSICLRSIQKNDSTLASPKNAFDKQQSEIIKRIKSCATGHARRPLIISASRGRGKSAALGIAIAEIIFSSDRKIFVTAPSKRQLAVFYRHLNRRLKEQLNQYEHSHITKLQAMIDSQLTFLAPDELALRKSLDGLLVIEEAGSIPTQLLNQYLHLTNRMIFSTTLDGYEGNGQGFEIRFKQTLKNAYPQYRQVSMTIPARWAQFDLLEHSMNKAFLLDTVMPNENIETYSLNPFDSLNYRHVTQEELSQNEPLLRELYGLLVNAHYQTRPSDLEMILQDCKIKIFIATLNNTVIAAALTIEEGPLTEQQQGFIQSKRRVSGHLLPQSLLAHQGFQQAASLKFLRVMRISVSPKLRRHRIASKLLSLVEQYATQNQFNFVGASFSLFSDVIKFWFHNDYSISRIGLRRDSSTGAPTGEFIKLTLKTCKTSLTLLQQISQQFSQRFFYLASSSLVNVSTDIMLLIYCFQFNNSILKDDLKERAEPLIECLIPYFEQQRSLEMIEWEAYQVTKLLLLKSNEGLAERDDKSELFISAKMLFAKLIQRKNWKTIVEEFQTSGEKESRKIIRLSLQGLVKNNDLKVVNYRHGSNRI